MTAPIDFPDNPSRADLERISRWAGVKLEDLVALSHDVDPFLTGTDKHNAHAARFVSLIEFLADNIGINTDTHLRDVHYDLLNTHAPYEAGEWDWLMRASGRARDLGLIEPWAFPNTKALLLSERGDGEVEYQIVKPKASCPDRLVRHRRRDRGLLAVPGPARPRPRPDREGL